MRKLIRAHTQWPTFLRKWHAQQLRITTINPATVKDILENVNKPTRISDTCTCKAICGRLHALGMHDIPLVEGHLFAIGREFTGPWARPLKENAQNIPRQTAFDARRAWDTAFTALPVGMVEQHQWCSLFKECTKKYRSSRLEATWFSTRDVYQLRKTLQGAVIGHIDRNIGELSVVCPVV